MRGLFDTALSETSSPLIGRRATLSSDALFRFCAFVLDPDATALAEISASGRFAAALVAPVAFAIFF